MATALVRQARQGWLDERAAWKGTQLELEQRLRAREAELLAEGRLAQHELEAARQAGAQETKSRAYGDHPLW